MTVITQPSEPSAGIVITFDLSVVSVLWSHTKITAKAHQRASNILRCLVKKLKVY